MRTFRTLFALVEDFHELVHVTIQRERLTVAILSQHVLSDTDLAAQVKTATLENLKSDEGGAYL